MILSISIKVSTGLLQVIATVDPVTGLLYHLRFLVLPCLDKTIRGLTQLRRAIFGRKRVYCIVVDQLSNTYN